MRAIKAPCCMIGETVGPYPCPRHGEAGAVEDYVEKLREELRTADPDWMDVRRGEVLTSAD